VCVCVCVCPQSAEFLACSPLPYGQRCYVHHTPLPTTHPLLSHTITHPSPSHTPHHHTPLTITHPSRAMEGARSNTFNDRFKIPTSSECRFLLNDRGSWNPTRLGGIMTSSRRIRETEIKHASPPTQLAGWMSLGVETAVTHEHSPPTKTRTPCESQ